MRKNRKVDYIIMALGCLVFLNIGAVAIRAYSNFKGPFNINEEKKSMIVSVIEYVEDKLDSLASLTQVINLLGKEDSDDTDLHISKEDVEKYKEDVEKEVHSEDDIIIKRLEEYENLIIVKDSESVGTIENIPEPVGVKKIKVNKDEPYVFVYHTHATESYMHFKKDNYRSSNRKDNVVGIGDILSTVLEANGHKVNHNDVYHDLPSYNKSYSRSLNTINTEKNTSDNLKFFLDIHRDAVEETSSHIEKVKKDSKIEINGKTVTTFSLVVGPDSPNKEEVLNFAKYIKAVSDSMYPGLCTKILIKPRGKYNQHMSDYSALIEMGYNFNDLEEVRESAKLVGEILSYAFNGLIEE